jgi:hypothetical protein
MALESQVIAVPPPAELPPVELVLPAMPVEPPLVAAVPPDVALPLPPAERVSLPLPPQADPKAAAPESSTATAQKLDFEEVRMGSTDHLTEHSSQCTEWIPTCL